MAGVIEYICLNCGCNCERPSKGNYGGKYCSVYCHQEFAGKERVSKWLSGELRGWTGKTRQLKVFVRRYLHDKLGSKCSLCGWNELHPIDGKVLTEVDHIDGNAENCRIENLRIICPNCHSMTPNFRARNSKSTRDRS
jgi:hypothetical protein